MQNNRGQCATQRRHEFVSPMHGVVCFAWAKNPYLREKDLFMKYKCRKSTKIQINKVSLSSRSCAGKRTVYLNKKKNNLIFKLRKKRQE